MPVESEETFGERLVRSRQAAGFSQRDLAAEIGISNRMVAYYEEESRYHPAHLMPVRSKALSVSADQLMGLEKSGEENKQRDNRLWRRFGRVEKLPPLKRRQVVQIPDAFLEDEKLRKASRT